VCLNDFYLRRNEVASPDSRVFVSTSEQSWLGRLALCTAQIDHQQLGTALRSKGSDVEAVRFAEKS
jgi:hypothetical protein